MSTVVKDLGAVSAYAYAVEKGYTGTEAEFAELMADYAEVGQRAEDAADSALESKTAAQTAATTATNKASEATTAATTATTKAQEAVANAEAAARDASQAMSAESTATSKATEATTAAATAVSAKDDAVSANTAAQSAKTAAQTAQTGAETAAASVEASAAQITKNATDINELKSDFNNLKENLSSYDIVHKTNISTKLGAFRYVNGVWGFTDAGAFGGGNFILKKYDAKPSYTYISKAYIYNSVCGMTFVDENENVLETVGYDSSQDYVFKTVIISGKAPKNTAYVYVQENDGGKCSLGEYTPVMSNGLVTGLLRQSDAQSSFESVTGAVAYSGSSLDIRTNGAWANWITEKFFVYPGETYTVRGCHMNIQPIGAYVTTNRVVSPIWRDENDTAYTVKSHEVTITIPDDVVELWVHRYNTWAVENSAIYPHLISKKGIFEGKTWYCIGDSITEYNVTATKKYYDFIQEKTGILPISLAVGGRGYINGGSDNTNRFYQQIINVPTTADVITVFGGGNDLTSFDLGDVTDTGTSTICGCINKTIDDLYSNFPLAKLGIITPNPWVSFPTTNDSNKMALLSDAIVEICRMRGIPCLNLYRCSGMRPWDTAFKELVYDLSKNDGVHPNNIGHEMMASHIQEFIKQLLI
jgi:lysophospholipase L1-like esterase